MVDRKQQPPIDWVNTSAGGEHEPGNESAGGTVGSGANAITRAGLRNADPDGFDVDHPEQDRPTYLDADVPDVDEDAPR